MSDQATKKIVEDAERYAASMGFVSQLVIPPWAGESSACRGCNGIIMPTTIFTITRRDASRKILFYSFLEVCERCVSNRATMNRLAVEVFAPYLPPGPIPS